MTTMNVGRWQTLTISQQLGNIASEFARFRSSVERGEGARTDQAYARLHELVSLTLEDPRWTLRRSELDRLEESIRHLGGERSELEVSFDDVESYLLPFAVLARQRR